MTKEIPFLKIIFSILLLLILGNLFFLDWKLTQEGTRDRIESEITNVVAPTPIPSPDFIKTNASNSGQLITNQIPKDDLCPQACLLAIDKAITVPTQTPSSSAAVTPGVSSMKIFYLPLGSGSTKDQDWTDVPGLNAYIDPVNYGKIKSIIFEASLRIPTANGRIYVRLYNKNDKRPVWFSEISSEGSVSTLIQSAPISFEPGNKLYQVQAKTTMSYESFVDFARVKFITE